MAKSPSFEAVCAQVVKRLQAERERRGLSKYALGQKSGVSQSMLGLVERGLRNPTLETLLKIAAALEVDLGEIVSAASRDVARSRKR